MILATSGTSYIGSHACVVLMQTGHDVLILDNLCNSRADVLDRLITICGWQAKRGIEQMCADAWRWQQTVKN